MSLTSTPNQPIIFSDSTDVCVSCGSSDWKQLVDINDQLFFQLKASPCGDKLPLSNYEVFNWTLTGRTVCGDAELLGSYTFNFATTLPFTAYKIVFVVSEMTAGELNFYIDGSDTYTIYTAGTYEFILNTDVALNGNLNPQVYVTSSNFVGCFYGAPEIYGIDTNVQVGWLNADDNSLFEMATIVKTVVEDYVTVGINMPDQPVSGEVGCFRLGISDSCLTDCGQMGLINGEFTSTDAWSITAGNWVISDGKARFDGDTSDPTTLLYNSVELCEGLQYKVTVVISSISNTRLFVQAGTGSTSSPAYEATAGTHEYTLTAGTGTANFTLRAQALVNGAYVVVESVKVELAGSDVDFTQYSGVLSIGNYEESTCDNPSLVISGCCAQDQFGIGFNGTSFLPSVRLVGERIRPQYEVDVDSFRNSDGVWNAAYVDRRKKYTFHFGRVPEHILDFLSAVIYFDNCYINGDSYYPATDEFPQVQYDDADKYLGRLDIDMFFKAKKSTKVQCSAYDANCLPSILDNSDEPFLLLQNGERVLLQDNDNLYTQG